MHAHARACACVCSYARARRASARAHSAPSWLAPSHTPLRAPSVYVFKGCHVRCIDSRRHCSHGNFTRCTSEYDTAPDARAYACVCVCPHARTDTSSRFTCTGGARARARARAYACVYAHARVSPFLETAIPSTRIVPCSTEPSRSCIPKCPSPCRGQWPTRLPSYVTYLQSVVT